MSITELFSPFFSRRSAKIEKTYSDAESLQREVLKRLLAAAAGTQYGVSHLFSATKDYDAFALNVPLNTYEELKDDIDIMRHGESGRLWRGRVKWFAKSSGTTNDKSKFIPVTEEGLRNIHYKGGFDTIALYLGNNPKSRFFDGRSLILGGSCSPNYNLSGTLVGDLSAILIEKINPLANILRVPRKETALIADFEMKRRRIAEETRKKNVTNISGVPSWMLSVLDCVMEESGKSHLEEVWPNIEVFFHGGVAFAPYRKQYERLITKCDMRYMETYNASEGFFGIQNDPGDTSLLLMVDYDVFYEFIPMSEFNSPTRRAVPLWGVKEGVNYAIVISSSCGLWRYIIGDTVRFTSTKPYKFILTGRTKSFINAFGEELIVDNAEKALSYASDKTGAVVNEYTAAPVFMDGEAKCRHQWLIEFVREPGDMTLFAAVLDAKLQEINSDYEAKRFKNITLQPLEIVKARKGLFNDWLRLHGKLGGQHKIPRLNNDRSIIDNLLRLNDMGL